MGVSWALITGIGSTNKMCTKIRQQREQQWQQWQQNGQEEGKVVDSGHS
jgi:hypothetical protein